MTGASNQTEPAKSLLKKLLPKLALAGLLFAPATGQASDRKATNLEDKAMALVHSLQVHVLDKRPLSPKEIAYAKTIFGDQIDYSRVQIREYARDSKTDRAFTTGDTIFFPKDDYDKDLTPRGNVGVTLAHELTHVWEHQKEGIVIPLAAAGIFIENRGNYEQAYEVPQGLSFDQMNIEQKAKTVERYAGVMRAIALNKTDPDCNPIRADYIQTAKALYPILHTHLPVQPIEFPKEDHKPQAAARISAQPVMRNR